MVDEQPLRTYYNVYVKNHYSENGRKLWSGPWDSEETAKDLVKQLGEMYPNRKFFYQKINVIKGDPKREEFSELHVDANA